MDEISEQILALRYATSNLVMIAGGRTWLVISRCGLLGTVEVGMRGAKIWNGEEEGHLLRCIRFNRTPGSISLASIVTDKSVTIYMLG